MILGGLLYIAAFVFILSVIVIVHEGGHFFVARLCHVKVTEFSIGFGKVLFNRKDKQGTMWKVCAIPLGGYVKMLGDDDAAGMTKKKVKIAAADKPFLFPNRPLWQRVLIVFAGPAMNYVFAFICLTGILFFAGEMIVPAVIGDVMPDTPAEQAGIVSGDVVQKINDKEIKSYQDIWYALKLRNDSRDVTLRINRQGQEKIISVKAFPADEVLGVVLSEKDIFHQSYGLWGAARRAGVMIERITTGTLVYLKQIIFNGRSAKGIRGPLGIAEASGDALKAGGMELMLFIVNISVAVGLMNLLPIPALDGGHLMLFLIEGLTGRPLSEKAQAILLWTGMILLFSLLIFTLFLDTPRILQRIMK